MDRPQVITWSDQQFEEVRPGIFGATIHTEQLTATWYRYEPGSSWETHQHPQDQITTIVNGEIDFVVDGQPVTLRAGQTSALPGNVPHSATVGEHGCETINVWTLRR